MKADANELCRVGHILAQGELTLHCGWKLDLATPTQVLALVWWKAVHQLRELIYLKSKATRRESFFCILQLVGSVSAALTGGMGSEAQAFGGGWCRLSDCAGFSPVKLMEPHPSGFSSTTWDRHGCLLVNFQQWNFWAGLVLLMEKSGLVQVVRCVLGNHGEIEFLFK